MESGPVIETAAGRLRGTQAGGIHAFKGIPYGASTAGANRFLPPRPAVPWAGVREALSYHAQAPQAPRAKRRSELEFLLGPSDATPESEDCLTLNVWSPGLDRAKRPVMVWLHGGAFAYGSSNRAFSDGANLARRGDVVVVSVNHRLNIFGFLDLGEIGGEHFAQSGNAGVLDLLAALEWVRDNIAAFGGDPANVTIFGESGGGGKVSVLMAMPAARGLFHRAIVQSGAGVRMRTRERGLALTAAVLDHLGISRGEWERLQQVSVRALLEAIAPASRAIGPTRWKLLDRYDFGPVVDGEILPQQPFDPDAPAIADDIPLMIGGTRDESALFLADDDAWWRRQLNEGDVRGRIAAIAGDEADALIAAYRRARPKATAAQLLVAVLTGGNFWIRSVLLAERKAMRRGAPVHMYSLDWGTPVHDGRLGAHHAIDVAFVFDTVDVPQATAAMPGARELAARMSATWAAFARHGTPDNAAIPHWPAYTESERATMIFDTECRIDRDPGRDARLLWSRVATR
ncbi:MAG: carboxylesterase/lipase family protein [Alphaproteobacteria bacterium]|nr:carboxylesterase/lipase family protein [Alphaproteobacteria bacterium]